jgi:hypothetical protein
MYREDFDRDAAAKRRLADLIEDAGRNGKLTTVDICRPGSTQRWRLGELLVEYLVDEITEKQILSYAALMNNEAELGRIVARDLSGFLYRIVEQEDGAGLMTLEERDDIDRRATAADIAWDQAKAEGA